MNLVAKHAKLCKYFLENSVYLGFFTPYANKHAPFTLEKNHTVCADSWNCSLQVSLMLLEDRAKPAEVLSIKQAEVLSVRFPKEYDHINVAAKHPKFCTNFIQTSIDWYWSIHISTHTFTHACMHANVNIPSFNLLIVDIIAKRNLSINVQQRTKTGLSAKVELPTEKQLSQK